MVGRATKLIEEVEERPRSRERRELVVGDEGTPRFDVSSMPLEVLETTPCRSRLGGSRGVPVLVPVRASPVPSKRKKENGQTKVRKRSGSA